MVGSIFISTMMTSWWGFVLFYAWLYPVGIGIVYWPGIICSWEWFPEHKGMISGLIIGAFGFGAFLFGFLTTALVNPDNLKPSIPTGGGPVTTDTLFPIEVAKRVPMMLRTCLAFWAALCLVAICTVTRNPAFVRKDNMVKRKPAPTISDEGLKPGSAVVDAGENVTTAASPFKPNPEQTLEELEANDVIGYKEAFTSRRFWHQGLLLF